MIVGLVGFINSGKGTVAGLLSSDYNFTQDSFAASLKDACASIFDWPRHMLEGDTKESREWRELPDAWWSEKLGIENFSPRLALQLIGTDALRNNFNQDLWFLTLSNRVRKAAGNVVVSDVRFPNEIKFIRDNGGVIIRINRGNLPVWYETALLANNGNSIAKEVMTKTYSSAHFSEWAWIGTKEDFEINNDSTLQNLHQQLIDIVKTIIK